MSSFALDCRFVVAKQRINEEEDDFVSEDEIERESGKDD
jgi:hypothetical protein